VLSSIAAFSQEKMEQCYLEAGAIKALMYGPGNAMGSSTHAYGGTRMGLNGETYVVNKWGFAHEVPNLGVLGASVMGSSGSRHPTLMVQALSWRAAEHLTNNWRSIVG
jgi:choline dehydrogenase-like flavoprotein